MLEWDRLDLTGLDFIHMNTKKIYITVAYTKKFVLRFTTTSTIYPR